MTSVLCFHCMHCIEETRVIPEIVNRDINACFTADKWNVRTCRGSLFYLSSRKEIPIKTISPERETKGLKLYDSISDKK